MQVGPVSDGRLLGLSEGQTFDSSHESAVRDDMHHVLGVQIASCAVTLMANVGFVCFNVF